MLNKNKDFKKIEKCLKDLGFEFTGKDEESYFYGNKKMPDYDIIILDNKYE